METNLMTKLVSSNIWQCDLDGFPSTLYLLGCLVPQTQWLCMWVRACMCMCACVRVCVPWKFTSVLNPLVVHRITPSDIQMLGWIQVLSSDIARIISITQFNMICLPNTDFFSSLVGALSPVNHKGLHLGWTQTSLYLQVSRFTSHHTTKSCFF